MRLDNMNRTARNWECMGGEGRHAAAARIGRDGKFMYLGWRRSRQLSGDVRLDVGYAHH